MARICIIGGGFGGLAVAARLAAKRHEVVLFERSEQFGGQVQTVQRDGFSFDTGPGLLTLPAVYRDLFLKTGRPLEDEVELIEQEPGRQHHFADGSVLQLPGGGSGQTAAAVTAQFGEKSGEQWRSMSMLAKEIWQAQQRALLTGPIRNRKQLVAALGGRGSLARSRYRHSLHSTATRLFSDPRLVHLVDRYAARVGTDPHTAPGTLIAHPYVEQMFGLWRFAGGMGALRDALVRRASYAGAALVTGAEVTEVLCGTGGITGVRLADGTSERFDLVVSDIDGTTLYSELISDPRAKAITRSLRRGTMSYSGFTVLLGLAGATPAIGSADPTADHSIWYPKRPEPEFRDLAKGRPARDPVISASRMPEPGMAPAGHESWCLHVNAPGHGSGRAQHRWTKDTATQYTDHLLDLLASRGLDLRERVTLRAEITPAHHAGAGGPGGALHGIVGQGPLGPLQRPQNISAIPGLFLVGGTTHPGPGLPLAGLSAEIVAETIGGDDGPDAGPSCQIGDH